MSIFITIFVIILLIALVPVIVLATWNYRNFANASEPLFGSTNILQVLNVKPLNNTNSRVNLLLVGYSADNPGHGGADLTDSILLLSLDQKDPSGTYMLSIPRDLYVNISNEYGYGKINEAYQAGERTAFSEAGYPNGGMGQLQQTISETLGITVHYNALINYAAVRNIVDALGGVTVTIQSDDERGLYDPNFQPNEGGPLRLPNGQQEIDGQTALRLTRARGAAGGYGFGQSDFTRTKNQQLVVSAILNELNWTLVLDPRTNGKIFTAVANNVETDVTLNHLIPLYRLLTKTPTDAITSYTLRDINGTNYLSSYTTQSGQAALIPRSGIDNFNEIQSALDTL